MAFEEGKHGRGSTPYAPSMSAKPAGHKAHFGASGRGGPGRFGGAEGNKGHRSDMEHPQSHSAFETLGTGMGEE